MEKLKRDTANDKIYNILYRDQSVAGTLLFEVRSYPIEGCNNSSPIRTWVHFFYILNMRPLSTTRQSSGLRGQCERAIRDSASCCSPFSFTVRGWMRCSIHSRTEYESRYWLSTFSLELRRASKFDIRKGSFAKIINNKFYIHIFATFFKF